MSDPADEIARYVKDSGAVGALVVDGNADDMIAGLVAAGWTLQEGAAMVGGKRVRFICPPPAQITRTEFERGCAERGISLEAMRKRGRYVKRCHCGESECQGWQSARVSDWEEAQQYEPWQMPLTLRPGECEARCDDDCECGPVHCLWIHEPNNKPGWHSEQDCPVFGPVT
jgi:hypothetical protein